MDNASPQQAVWFAPRLRSLARADRAADGTRTYDVEYSAESILYAPAS